MALRPARREDLAAVVAVMNAVDVATLGEPDTTEDDIASGWQESGFELSADAFVAEEDGAVVGYTELYDRGSGGVFDVDVYVHPDAAPEIAKGLLDAVLQRASVRAGSGARLSTCLPVDDPRMAVFEAAGFSAERRFQRMRLESQSPPAPQAPHPFTLRAFDRERDAAAVHNVLVEAFAGHVRPMTPSLARFSEQHLDHPDFDPAFWVVAEDDAMPVGAITAFNHGDIGFIRHVGVRSTHRGRGIGGALVCSALHRLGQVGQQRVDLGVDADDDGGAARLYQTLGFSTLQRLVLVERAL